MTNIAPDSNIKLSRSELDFLNRNEICRVATNYKGIPHVVPVSYIVYDDKFVFATDYNTIKYRNILYSKKIALVVDVVGTKNSAIMVQGDLEIIENGKEFQIFYAIFSNKFLWVKREPWKEGEAPFIKVTPYHKVTWGLN